MNRLARFGMHAALCVGGLVAGPARALDMPAAAARPMVSVEQVPSSSEDGGLRGQVVTSTETMLWLARGRLAFGVGVESSWLRPPSPALAPTRAVAGPLLLGVSVRTSARSRLIWQAPATTAALADGPVGAGAARRPALDLRRSDPYRNLLRGTFRYELGQGTALSLKANARRVGVAFTSQW